jgi:hypothetical protein
MKKKFVDTIKEENLEAESDLSTILKAKENDESVLLNSVNLSPNCSINLLKSTLTKVSPFLRDPEDKP